jgi:hypothetical protein
MTRPAPSKLVDDLVKIRQWSQRAQGQAIAEVDTINVLIGDGTNVLTTGVKAAVRADFKGRITGGFVHEFDGTTGSVSISIDKALYEVGFAPTFASISASSPLTIAAARYGENVALAGWTTEFDRGELLRFNVTSATAFMRLLVTLRVRRLEP